MDFVTVRREAGLCELRPTEGLHSLRALEGELENNSRQPKKSKQQGRGSLRKRVNLLFLLWGSCEGGVEVDERMMKSENQSS
jgi:hypothetical protein